MSSDKNYSKQGKCFGQFALFVILFIILVVYIYQGNYNSVPLPK